MSRGPPARGRSAGFHDTLYYLGCPPERRLASCVLPSLPPLVDVLRAQLPPQLHTPALRAVMAAAIGAWRRTVLDGGPGRAFQQDEAPLLEDDLVAMRAAFVQHGARMCHLPLCVSLSSGAVCIR